MNYYNKKIFFYPLFFLLLLFFLPINAQAGCCQCLPNSSCLGNQNIDKVACDFYCGVHEPNYQPVEGYPKYSNFCEENTNCPLDKKSCCIKINTYNEKIETCTSNITQQQCNVPITKYIDGQTCEEINCSQGIGQVLSTFLSTEYRPPEKIEKFEFIPQVTIPGSVQFGGKIFSVNEGQGIEVNGELLSKYIAVLFNWLIGAIGVIVVAYMGFGGMQWLAAAGSAEGINKAKETIRDSMIGLLLVASSYTVLYFINPQLVGFKTLVISEVEAMLLYSGENSDTGVSDLISNGNFFKQCDSRWGNMDYENGGKGCTLCSSGCGATAVAIVLANLGLNETPETVGQYAIEIGARNGCSNGTSVQLLNDKPKSSWGVRTETISNFDKAMELLEQGNWLVASIKQVPVTGRCQTSECGQGICFCGGHLVVLTKKSGNTISIMDPSRVGINSMTVEQFKKYNSYEKYFRFWK